MFSISWTWLWLGRLRKFILWSIRPFAEALNQHLIEEYPIVPVQCGTNRKGPFLPRNSTKFTRKLPNFYPFLHSKIPKMYIFRLKLVWSSSVFTLHRSDRVWSSSVFLFWSIHYTCVIWVLSNQSGIPDMMFCFRTLRCQE